MVNKSLILLMALLLAPGSLVAEDGCKGKSEMTFAGPQKAAGCSSLFVPLSARCHDLWLQAAEHGFTEAMGPSMLVSPGGGYLYSSLFMRWNKVSGRLELDCSLSSEDVDVVAEDAGPDGQD